MRETVIRLLNEGKTTGIIGWREKNIPPAQMFGK